MRLRHTLLLLFALICLFAIAGPDYGLVGNRLTPTVLGVPFSLFWNVLWVGLSFGALFAFHLADGGES